MERARTEWLRASGFDQVELAERYGVIFVVRSAAIDYLAPGRFNDELQVTVELIKVGAGQIDLVQRVLRGDALLAKAAVKVASVARTTMRPTRLPQPLATRIRTQY
jgi:acyl-CoA thioester hydrolase